eukprot:6894953-Ditylum_brightwellii.AAC.1
MRDHPPIVQVIPQEEEKTMLAMLAKVGLLPSKLGQVQLPSCANCVYGSMTRRPWRGKQALNARHKIKRAQRAGQCISVDQMEST